MAARRTYFGELLPEDFHDRKGHFWTERAILSRSLPEFIRDFSGSRRISVDIYCYYSEYAKIRERTGLNIRERERFDSLDSNLFAFESAFYKMVIQFSPMRGGTALATELAQANAAREAMLRATVRGWNRREYCSRQRWESALRAVNGKLGGDFARKCARRTKIVPFDWHAYETAHKAAGQPWSHLQHLGSALPHFPHRLLANRFFALAMLADALAKD